MYCRPALMPRYNYSIPIFCNSALAVLPNPLDCRLFNNARVKITESFVITLLIPVASGTVLIKFMQPIPVTSGAAFNGFTPSPEHGPPYSKCNWHPDTFIGAWVHCHSIQISCLLCRDHTPGEREGGGVHRYRSRGLCRCRNSSSCCFRCCCRT
jgi:hypothetical protein